jgi:hypothetical protein
MGIAACFHRRDAEDAEKEKTDYYELDIRLAVTGQKKRA